MAHSCSLCVSSVRFAEEACAVLLSVKFAPCHYEVNPEPYVKNCRYDVCSCADGQECLCDAVRSYAAACAAKGVLINWRGQGYCGNYLCLFCGMTCWDNSIFFYLFICVVEQNWPVRMTRCTRRVETCVIRPADRYPCLTATVRGCVRKAVSVP